MKSSVLSTMIYALAVICFIIPMCYDSPTNEAKTLEVRQILGWMLLGVIFAIMGKVIDRALKAKTTWPLGRRMSRNF